MRWPIAVLLLAACSSRSPSPSAPPDPPVVEPSEPHDPPPPEAPPEPARASDAIDAYRALVRAFNEHDRDAYFGAFADSLDCYYGRTGVPLATVRERRLRDGDRGLLAAARIEVLRRSAGEVALLDRGFYSDDPGGGRQVLHEKIVVMRRDGERWRVVAETSWAERACLGDRVPAEAAPDPRFDACRSDHRACIGACTCASEDDACRRCRLACEEPAMRCLGLRGGGTVTPASAPPPIALASVEDVRRFVALALTEAAEEVGGASAEMSPEDARWYAAVSLALGAPRWRRVGSDGEVSCGWLLFSMQDAQLFERVVDVRCTDSRDRCVAYLAATDYESSREALGELHLLFDGSTLRVALATSPRVASIDPAALDRFATRPPGWDEACQPTLIALLEDRAGDDFFRVSADPMAEEPAYEVRRACGAAARAAVSAIGDRWDCDDEECTVLYTCGNYCEHVTFDGAGRVLAYSEGIDALPIDEDTAASLRQRVRCGATARIAEDDLLE